MSTLDDPAIGPPGPWRKRSTWTAEERARLQAALDKVHAGPPSQADSPRGTGPARSVTSQAAPIVEAREQTAWQTKTLWSLEQRVSMRASLDRVHGRPLSPPVELPLTTESAQRNAPQASSALTLDGRPWTDEQRSQLQSALADLQATRLAARLVAPVGRPGTLSVPGCLPAVTASVLADVEGRSDDLGQTVPPSEWPEVIEDPPLPQSFEALFCGESSPQVETSAAVGPVPVVWAVGSAQAQEFVLPKPPPGHPPRWYGPDEPVEVHGVRLPGLVRVAMDQIVGTQPHASTVAAWLPVEFEVPAGEVQPLPASWVAPAYASLTPSHRGLYLRWLASGRGFSVPPGLGMLFLYCLESRLREVGPGSLADAERAAMARAARELAESYGASSPRARECGLNLAGFLDALGERPQLYRRQPPDMPVSYDVPAPLQVAIGQAARDGAELPVEWALAFVRCDPSASRRTPVGRCPVEFGDMFSLRFARDFPKGLKLRRGSSRPLELVYKCMPERETDAQPTVSAQMVLALSAMLSELQQTQLREAADWCSERLSAYSRFLGREPAAAGTMDAEVRLPGDLLKQRLAARLDGLVKAAGTERAVSAEQAWQALWGGDTARRDSAPFLHELLRSVGLTVDPKAAAAKSTSKEMAPAVPVKEFRLDQSKLERVRQDDAAATQLLAALFAEVEEPPNHVGQPVGQLEAVRGVLPELDDDHFQLLSELLGRDGWTRESLHHVAQRLGLMLDGALERLNEAVLELEGSPLIIDDGELEVDAEIALALRRLLVSWA
jgi:hypothetical protein